MTRMAPPSGASAAARASSVGSSNERRRAAPGREWLPPGGSAAAGARKRGGRPMSVAGPPQDAGEGNLEAPTRHPLDWRNPEFYDEAALQNEQARIFDICHGCRRCVSLCNAFPTLFDLVDNSPTMEVDGVAKEDYWKVVDQCYLCDLCYMTKCPYVPPHPWNVDFPHLMLRAKSQRFRDRPTPARDRLLTSTDAVGKLATIPVVVQAVNKANTLPVV